MNAWMIMLGVVCASAVLAEETTNGVDDVAAREAELAAGVLVQENEALTAEVAKLRERMAQLTVSLAEALAELDVERSRAPGAAADEGSRVVRDGALDEADLRVVDINPSLNMIVFSGGKAKGVKAGLVFTVLRERTAVARVRTIDVREKIAGAVVEQAKEGRFPEKGDRVILAR
jgi:hypothetical protein